MATSILLRCARSALRTTDLATGCLPATGATAQTAIPLIREHGQQGSGGMVRLFSSRPPRTVVTLERKEYDKVFEVTDEIVSSEAKLHAFFLKWLSHNEGHFDIEDEEAFKERFEIFKGHAKSVNAWNKGSHSYICGINPYSDVTSEEFVSRQFNSKKKAGFHQTVGRSLPRRVNQVTVGGVKFTC